MAALPEWLPLPFNLNALNILARCRLHLSRPSHGGTPSVPPSAEGRRASDDSVARVSRPN